MHPKTSGSNRAGYIAAEKPGPAHESRPAVDIVDAIYALCVIPILACIRYAVEVHLARKAMAMKQEVKLTPSWWFGLAVETKVPSSPVPNANR